MSDLPLAQLRQKIDDLDLQLLALLNARAAVAHEVGLVKAQDGSPVYRPERERQVISGLQAANCGPILPDGIAHIWREVMSACRALERSQCVAFLGPLGTFSEAAARKFFGSSVTLLPCANLDEVFQKTESGVADFGVIPLENSTEGMVTRSMDLLLGATLQICSETSLPIRHNLLRLENNLEGVHTVLAHPQALAQCQHWLNQHLPLAERRAASSNAEGARLASLDAGCAALASERAGAEFGLHVVHSGVQDEANNRTRFAVIANPQPSGGGLSLALAPASASFASAAAPTHPEGYSISLAVGVANRPGALHDLIVPLKTHGVSMTRFESRPAKAASNYANGGWAYTFFVDLQGHPSQPHIASALAELQSLCVFYKVLGVYAQLD